MYTNNLNLPIPLVGWLLNDDYDLSPGTISASKLVKPIREIILAERLRKGEVLLFGEPVIPPPVDVSGLLRSRAGQAIHTGLENTWNNAIGQELVNKHLGLELDLLYNPEDTSKPLESVFTEIRAEKVIEGFGKVSGKFDMVWQGQLIDYKTGTAFKYSKDNTENYSIQGSVYRWLSPHIIQKDTAMFIEIYLDWSEGMLAHRGDSYPPAPTVPIEVPLMSIEDTETFIKDKLSLIRQYSDAPENELPECTDEELWIGPSEFKYYSREGLTRATKNFKEDSFAAHAYASANGGFVTEVQGKAKKCLYCPAFAACTQKDKLIEAGLLQI